MTKRSFRSLSFLLVTGSLAIAMTSVTRAANVDRGHRIILENGLQLHALVLDHSSMDLQTWADSNFTTANFHAGTVAPTLLAPPPGIPWGRWTDGHDGSGLSDFLLPAELPYQETLISLQVGDEQDLTNPQFVTDIAALMAQHKVLYPDTMTYTNQFGTQESVSSLQNYMSIAQPDIMSVDSYEFFEDVDGGSPTKLYSNYEKYRNLGLAGNDGTGTTPIPTAAYTQTFYGFGAWDRPVSTSEATLNQFAAWAFGFKMTNAFFYDVPQHVYDDGWRAQMFGSGGDQVRTPFFDHMAAMNAQSLKLGPALTRLVSTEVFMEMGQHEGIFGWTFDNTQPSGVPDWSAGSDPGYLDAVVADNLNPIVNGDLSGDVIISYFKPLHENFDGPSANNEQYFMVVNGLSDVNQEPSGTQQEIRLEFDFGASEINSLQRLNKDTGLVELVTLTPLGGSRYGVDLTMDGGEGDLYKYNTGAPFIGIDQGGFTVEANGVYIFDASTLTVALSSSGTAGSFGDMDFEYEWTVDGTLISTNANPGLPIVQSGLTSTTDSGTIQLEVMDGNFFTGSDTATFSYSNSAPTATPQAGDVMFDSSLTTQVVTGNVSDPDTAINPIIPGFESVSLLWSLGQNPNSTSNGISIGQAIVAGLTNSGATTQVTLTATDAAGLQDVETVDIVYDNATPTATVQAGDVEFNASLTTQPVTGGGTDPDTVVNTLSPGFEVLSFQWSTGQTPTSTSNTITASQAIAAGMVNSGATGQMSLTVTDMAGAQDVKTVDLTYDNAAPTATVQAGDVVFNASLATQPVSGGGTDPDTVVNILSPGFEVLSYQWSTGGAPTSQNNTITISQAIASGMTNTTAVGQVSLAVTDIASVVSAPESVDLVYSDLSPAASSASGVQDGLVMDLTGQVSDPDLIVNVFQASFEVVEWEFSLVPTFGVAQGTHAGTGAGNVNLQINPFETFPSFGQHTGYLNVRDLAGVTDSFSFLVDFAPVAGDMDANGIVDPADVTLFVLALNDPAEYTNQTGFDPNVMGDVDGGGGLDVDDIDDFEAFYVAESADSDTEAVPEPSSLVLLLVAALGLLGGHRIRRFGC